MEMPRRIIAEGDPSLAKQVQASDETASFDALCLLYVALTRARQGLYMVTAFPGRGAEVVRPATFLKVQLAGEAKPVDGKHVTVDSEELVCLYEDGEGDWYTKVPQKERAEIVEPCQLHEGFYKQPSRRRRLVLVSPSKSAEGEVKADSLFAPDRRDILDFGTGVHQLFQKISWIGEVNVEGLVRKWRQESTAAEDVKEKVIEHFRRVLASIEVRKALTRPRGNVTLWREKRFEVVLGERWITGIFDRVTIVRGPDGRPLRAVVLDFKSDEIAGGTRLADSAERHRSQMSLYGSVLSRMLRLDPSRIALWLLFTHPGKVYELG
jgi:ATP-dependent helicase/nuclease subunit A